MIGEYREIACPFCGEGRVQCIHVLASSSDFFRSAVKNDKPELTDNELRGFIPHLNIQVHSDCNMCGKTQEDIEKKLMADSKE